MRGIQTPNPAFIAIVSVAKQEGGAQPCLAVPRPRGSWRGDPGSVLYPTEGLRERGEVSAAARSSGDLNQQADLQRSAETQKQAGTSDIRRIDGLNR